MIAPARLAAPLDMSSHKLCERTLARGQTLQEGHDNTEIRSACRLPVSPKQIHTLKCDRILRIRLLQRQCSAACPTRSFCQARTLGIDGPNDPSARPPREAAELYIVKLSYHRLLISNGRLSKKLGQRMGWTGRNLLVASCQLNCLGRTNTNDFYFGGPDQYKTIQFACATGLLQ